LIASSGSTLRMEAGYTVDGHTRTHNQICPDLSVADENPSTGLLTTSFWFKTEAGWVVAN